MLVQLPERLDEPTLLRLAYDLAEAFGEEVLDLRPGPGTIEGAAPVLRLLEPQEQIPVTSDPGMDGGWLCVNLCRSYYGPGYERGPIVAYLAIAAWWEQRVPGALVWYGPDEPPPALRHLDRAARERLFEHFCRVGHQPYYQMSKNIRLAAGSALPRCCATPMTWVGWNGREVHVLRCLACKSSREVPNDGSLIIETDTP